MIKLPRGVNRKRWRFLPVKRTEAGIVLRPSFLQLDVVADDADNIRLLLHRLFEIFRGHGWGDSRRSPGIVSQRGADGNIPDLDCCGEAVGIDSYQLNADGKRIFMESSANRLVADGEEAPLAPNPFPRNSRSLFSRQAVIILLDQKQWSLPDGPDKNLHFKVQCLGVDRK